MDKPGTKQRSEQLSEDAAKSHYPQAAVAEVVGRDDRLTLEANMNKHFSDAYQVGAQEKTKQAEQETKQAEERTKQAKLELATKRYATLGIIGVFLIIVFRSNGAWEAVVALAAIWSPYSVASIIRAAADLTFQRKHKPITLPDLSAPQLPTGDITQSKLSK